MAESIINFKDPMKADVVLIGANYDKTSSFGKGSDKGPAAIKGCLDTQVEFLERYTQTSPVETLNIAYHHCGNLNSLYPEHMVDMVDENFAQFYKEGKFVIMLGGEHSVSNGPFRALHDKNKTTVLQIDAHLDMRDTDADYNDNPWGKYAHSCVMRRAVELGLKTVQVGIRAYSDEEFTFAKKHKSKVFEWGRRDVPTVDDIVSAIKTKKVYLTVDVDGIDPAHMPATGTPVQGGLEWYYTFELLGELFSKKEVVAADIVEVAPKANERLTEYGAAQICYNMIANKFW